MLTAVLRGREACKRALRRFGLDVRRAGDGRHLDAFADQRALLGGLPSGPILDVGANVGETTGRYRGLFPGATVHALEPGEAPFRSLQAAHRGDPAVRTHQIALSDEVGTSDFHASEDEQWSSLLRVGDQASDLMQLRPQSIASRSVSRVRTTTLDAFCVEHSIGRVGILKMDIQGGELAALRGAAGLLGSGAIDLIYSEVFFLAAYEGQGLFPDLCRELDRPGYRLFGLYNFYHGKGGLLVAADALWVRPGLGCR